MRACVMAVRTACGGGVERDIRVSVLLHRADTMILREGISRNFHEWSGAC